VVTIYNRTDRHMKYLPVVPWAVPHMYLIRRVHNLPSRKGPVMPYSHCPALPCTAHKTPESWELHHGVVQEPGSYHLNTRS
jgi:hypothetical protein